LLNLGAAHDAVGQPCWGDRLDFTGAGGTLDLTDPKGFWGEISGFTTDDSVLRKHAERMICMV